MHLFVGDAFVLCQATSCDATCFLNRADVDVDVFVLEVC